MNAQEAFQKLKGYIPLDWEETKLVETELNRLEKLEKENKELKTRNKVYERNHEQELIYIAELRNVLKIIKTRIKLGGLNEDTSKAWYPYIECDGLKNPLTKEEYDLLKEYFK